MGFKEDVEVLSGLSGKSNKGQGEGPFLVNYSALALELARELKEAKKEIEHLHAILDDVRRQRDELLAREMGRYMH